MPDVSATSLRAELRRLCLPQGLVVDRIEVEGGEVAVQTEPFGLRATTSKVRATLAALDIADFLSREAPGGLKDFAVAIRGGKLYIEATARVLVEVRAKAVCTLRIDHGTAVYVDLESVDVMGLGAKGMVQNQLDQINPVLNVADLPVAIVLESIEADHDSVVLTGRLA